MHDTGHTLHLLEGKLLPYTDGDLGTQPGTAFVRLIIPNVV